MSDGAEFFIIGMSILYIFLGIILYCLDGATIFAQLLGIGVIIFGSFILFLFWGGALLEYLGWYIY